INLVTAPYFLAGKFAAFAGRGNGDYLMSHDMEDIVAVLDGRPEIVEDRNGTSSILKSNALKRAINTTRPALANCR
ncbi:MAG: hypothetical protein KJ950_06930, partial [Proteobacteria bacterium]|nr:hypothetical protein [Pseudomonadota bacterium]